MPEGYVYISPQSERKEWGSVSGQKQELKKETMKYMRNTVQVKALTQFQKKDIYLKEEQHANGIGKEVMLLWENEMKAKGHNAVMTSTQVDESAQHFYRKIGYKDCGCLILNIPELEQPMEMFLIKQI